MNARSLDQRLSPPPRSASDFLRAALKRERGKFGSALLASAIINTLGLLLALFAMQVFDRVIPFRSSDTLTVLAAGIVVALVVQAALKTARNAILDKLGRDLEIELSQRIFNKTLLARLDERPNSVGTLAARISEFDAVSRLLSAHALFCLFDLPFVLLCIGLMFVIGGPMAAVPLLVLPLGLIFSRLSLQRLPALASDEIHNANQRHGMLVESIDGAETIKAYHAEGWFSRRWYNLSSRLSELSIATRSIVSRNTNIDEAWGQTAQVITLLAGVVLVDANRLSIGALIACCMLVDRSLQPVRHLGSLLADWSHAKEALKGLDEFLSQTGQADADNPTPVRLQKFSPSVSIENASLLMGEDRTLAIQVPKLDIRAGEKIAIIGPTGSGKTSLLRLLSGLYRPSEGRCFASDVDMQLQDADVLRKAVAYLPQQPTLFNSTLKDNLCAGLPPPDDQTLLTICKLVGLDKLVNSHPRGLYLPISEGGQGLSGGQSKLVGLARVLVQNASLLLLDEPTGALDPQSDGQLIARLKAHFRPDQTVIIVTHKMNLLQLVDRVLVVDQGRITADGPRDLILSRITPQQAGLKPATGAQAPGAPSSDPPAVQTAASSRPAGAADVPNNAN